MQRLLPLLNVCVNGRGRLAISSMRFLKSPWNLSSLSDPDLPGLRRGFLRVFCARVSCSRFSSPRSSLASASLSLPVPRSSPRLPPGAMSSALVGWLCLSFRSSLPSGGFGLTRVVVLSSLLDPCFPGLRRGFLRVFLIWSSR